MESTERDARLAEIQAEVDKQIEETRKVHARLVAAERVAFKATEEADEALMKYDLSADEFAPGEKEAWDASAKATDRYFAAYDAERACRLRLGRMESPGEAERRLQEIERKHARRLERREERVKLGVSVSQGRRERRFQRRGGRKVAESSERTPLPKAVINKIVKGMESGLSGKKVAEELNAAKEPTPTGKGRWNGVKVRQVFAQETGITDIKGFRAKTRGESPKRSDAKRSTTKRGEGKRAQGKRSQAKRSESKRSESKRSPKAQATKRQSSKRGASKRASTKRGGAKRDESAAGQQPGSPVAEVEPTEVESAEVEEATPVEQEEATPSETREVTPLTKEAQASGTSRGGTGGREKRASGKRRGAKRNGSGPSA